MRRRGARASVRTVRGAPHPSTLEGGRRAQARGRATPWWCWALVAVFVSRGASAESVRVVLRWRDVAGARAYELQVAKDPAFLEVVLQTRTTAPAYRWEHPPDAPHWWRVRSLDADGRPSEWSQARSVAADSPVPTFLRPAQGARLACGDAVELEFAASALVKEYVVELAASADFAAAKLLRAPDPRLVAGVLRVGTWYARASAVDVRGRSVGPGPTRTFSVRAAAPRPRPVASALLGKEAVLAWSDVPCARAFVVEVTAEAGAPVTLRTTEPRLPWRPAVAGTYRWKVAAVEEHGAIAEWSTSALVKVELPPPQPSGERVDVDAELTWAPVPTASSYRVEVVSQEPDGRLVEATVTQPAWRTPDLSPGRYTWRVRAEDGRGHVSAFSSPRRFERAPRRALSSPVLRPGFAGEVPAGGVLEVSWSPVEGATSYEVELDGRPAVAVGGTSFATSPLSEGWHRLRVRALGPGSLASPPSEALEVHAGPRPVAGMTVETRGLVVTVGLVDRLGRPVSDAAVSCAARWGAVGPPVPRDGRWVLAWRPPPSGDDLLTLDARGFRAEHVLRRPPPRGWLALSAGVVANGGAVLSPTGTLAAGVHLPWLEQRSGVELRVGLYAATSSATLSGVRYDALAWLVPASVLLGWRLPLGSWWLRGAVGPALEVAHVQVNEARVTRLLPGCEVSLSGTRRLGWGRLVLEVGFLYARLDDELAVLNAGGLALRVGYVLEL